ncbi:hypothetical protein AB4455_10395 [Vibrio sp. 10N.261.46.E12]|uniref:hypothetical protein n=1 Tax=unclassified Vibrio TaxID=2614977 RepID=UPI000977B20F|nr:MULTISPECIES: hypothetical protein [unclassified Vibrio]OMO36126.1 hypothetical protein BH584_04950 [Vibrio sp. 10N.261.45.E1]PMJ34522.1 hypothetical protein BCU27_03585 [Vibrio sp. 10N.286.45.B6]PML88050.1 hypothetical protein BCT66_10655 [Vibrio sp. 10N.261.49.E11]PMM67378.1 hypothetical protein BCT48_15125 [Vibrio sp. 10N.261.46.F12]PMM81739.1 hypothetical protein BCT46_15130 [Vibrio sp. 10N.261.46.E8]
MFNLIKFLLYALFILVGVTGLLVFPISILKQPELHQSILEVTNDDWELTAIKVFGPPIFGIISLVLAMVFKPSQPKAKNPYL